jgi:hypothetical protein
MKAYLKGFSTLALSCVAMLLSAALEQEASVAWAQRSPRRVARRPPPPPHHHHHRFMLKLDLGFGGTSETNLPGLTMPDKDLSPTVGFSLQNESIVHRFLALGGVFNVLFWQPQDKAYDDVSTLLDFDMVIKLRVPLPLHHDELLELYAALTPGLSLGVLGNDHPLNHSQNGRFGIGWNIAGFGGVQFNFLPSLGTFIECGYAYHGVWYFFKMLDDLQLENSEIRLNLGLVFIY